MNEKKKLLFVNNNFDTGGVQRSLINLLNEIADAYDITLFVFSNSGEYKDYLTERVKVIEANPLLNLLGISQVNAGNKGYLLYLIRGVLALYAKLINNYLPIRLLTASQKKLSGFDAAISFLHGSHGKLLYWGCNEFVLFRVNATEKITFLHCDFLQCGTNTPRNRELYKKFDKIAAVSKGCGKNFIKAVPDMAHITYCVLNCHNYSEYMARSSDNPVEYPKIGLNIVTPARLGPEKGILRGLDVISRLVLEGHNLRWYILGEGELREKIQDEIHNSGASDYIFLCGNKKNPYRYIINADILLLPSFHEAAPMVFDEAKCLGVPVISTDTISAREMVLEGREGFVCENSAEGLYSTIKMILTEPERLQDCKEYLSKAQYTNEKALSQFNRLINSFCSNDFTGWCP